jgi:DNA helicase II / ATP-dependent DNA helicase PcrA
MAPLKYYVTQQSRMGDRHVYGAKSRFLSRAVMQCLEPVAYGETMEQRQQAGGAATIDVALRLRGLWS